MVSKSSIGTFANHKVDILSIQNTNLGMSCKCVAGKSFWGDRLRVDDSRINIEVRERRTVVLDAHLI